ncbi:Dihydrolipoyllysine-residue acetyltransferase component of pyruvate dehydrogenase complex [Pseudomonas extremaustralis]|uniref:Dihydrolipoamide acetyltransferase component of pyruvate dehydrogenase complex n=1 Tax=Pseudomonas extremaustralis TaxID=359110 RepID=A0A5M9J1A0_9PSED|nr:dihydrolipoyllysine-residue acetyltransferase [Pseudomonas extremaustralis]KAA8562824.1 Dihydrolipoyllysine-residue acetyltransferase component of pyruvate dehydrogenase complex [Pseudomonas extremaustralis]
MTTMRDILVPDIGDFKEISIIEVLVAPGDLVAAGQTIIVVETDKATMDIPTSHDGKIKDIKIVVGDKISEGSLIATLEQIEASAGQSPSMLGETPEAEKKPRQLAVSSEPPAPVQAMTPLPELAGTKIIEKVVSSAVLPFASPSVRKLARELGVPLNEINGTGPKARITKDDLHAFVSQVMVGVRKTDAQKRNQTAQPFMEGILPWPDIDFTKFGEVKRVDLSRLKKISGANLYRNWLSIPHVTNHDDADVTDLEDFRRNINEENANLGVKVTMIALVMKVCVAALKKFPEFNSSLDGGQLVLKNYFHIGFAADTPNGLVVPVIRDVDKKGVVALAREMSELSAKARAGKLEPSDMSGGCFTVSSLGGIGGTYFTPIINAPEVAILGIGRSNNRVFLENGQVVQRLILPLSLSWDHRVIDGAAAGRFNAFLVEHLADMRRLMM